MSFRMLLLVDGSPWSRSARSLALNLLEHLDDAELTALHVVNVVPPSGNIIKDLPGHLGFEPAIVSQEIGEEHDEVGRQLLGEIKVQAQQRGLEVTTVLEHGAVIERAVHWAEKFDLVLLGLRGQTEARFKGQGGASSHNIVASTSRPTILTPAGVDTVTGIAVGYDGSAAAKHALSAIRPFVDHLKWPVHAIHVSQDGTGSEVLAEVAEQLPEDTVLFTHSVTGDSVHQALAKAADAHGANMLALGFRGKSPMKDFLFGSASEYIVSNTQLVVLVSH